MMGDRRAVDVLAEALRGCGEGFQRPRHPAHGKQRHRDDGREQHGQAQQQPIRPVHRLGGLARIERDQSTVVQFRLHHERNPREAAHALSRLGRFSFTAALHPPPAAPLHPFRTHAEGTAARDVTRLHDECKILAQRALYGGGELRRLLFFFRIFGRGPQRRHVERDTQRRRTQNVHDRRALRGLYGIYQLDDVADALRRAHADRTRNELAAFAPVHGETQQLRDDETAEQHQHHAREQRPRQQAFQLIASTVAANT
ncbi:MAG: hypothetical protein K8S22_05835 [Betaproteobacteria bacterium]|nr:hypothetical protein [Betaproteobacteria bacterium]